MSSQLVPMLLSALFAIFPARRSEHMARMARAQESIAERLVDAAAAYPEVPSAILLSVCFHETHCGTDRGDPDWGSPVDRRHRHIAGTHRSAARDLAHSFTVCRSWLGALHRYRVGLCNGRERIGYTAEQALSLAERLSARADVPLPEHWR